ncbi:MAG: hydantoinase B/oxoprolinase family protein, partial [Pseudomonadota bacterium]
EGAMTRFAWQTDEGWQTPPMASKLVGARIRAGQRLRLETPGGGGYGPPGDRAADAIARDRALEFTTEGAIAHPYATRPEDHA